jgi:hypothetical protein
MFIVPRLLQTVGYASFALSYDDCATAVHCPTGIAPETSTAHRPRSIRPKRGALIRADTFKRREGSSGCNCVLMGKRQFAEATAAPPTAGLCPFFATRRSVETVPRLLPFEELTLDEQAACKRLDSELLGLRRLAAEERPDEEIAFTRSWYLTASGPITLVCAELASDQTGPLAALVRSELYRAAVICRSRCHGGAVRAHASRNPRTGTHLTIPSEVGLTISPGTLFRPVASSGTR